MFLFKVGEPTLVSVIMFSGANVRVLGFLPDLQGWVLWSSPLATWDLLYEVAGEVESTIGFEPVWKGGKSNRTEPNRN